MEHESFDIRYLFNVNSKFRYDYGPKKNPFRPWDKGLEVSTIKNTHTIILNKYPVELGHMLLITNEWKPQNGWLEIKDLEAISEIESDTNGLWFFNSCKEAGASQPHRHIQLLRRNSNQDICPRYKYFEDLIHKKEQYKSELDKLINCINFLKLLVNVFM